MWLLAIVTLALIAFFIYPTPYVYMVDAPIVFRTSRITGKTEVSSSEGWKPYLTLVIPPHAEGAGAPNPAPAPRTRR